MSGGSTIVILSGGAIVSLDYFMWTATIQFSCQDCKQTFNETVSIDDIKTNYFDIIPRDGRELTHCKKCQEEQMEAAGLTWQDITKTG